MERMTALSQRTVRFLSRFRPQHLSAVITIAHGSTCTVLEYIDMFAEHESIHAAELVPASRARRVQALP